MPLIYSLVARGTTVLADYTAYTGNFSTVAIQCLEKCPTSNSNFTLTCDGHTFNYTIDGCYIFLAVADEEYGRIPFVFLERVQAEWKETLATRGLYASAHSLDKTFGPRLRFHMEYCQSLVEELTGVAAVQNKVGKMKNIMVDNIENVLARGEKVELRVDTDDLRFQADKFNKTGKELCCRMWWQDMRRRILILTVVFAFAVTLFLLLCFAPADPCIK